MSIAHVQTSAVSQTTTITLPAAPTAGNLLVLNSWTVTQSTAVPVFTGWSLAKAEQTGISPPGSKGSVQIYYKIVDGDTASITLSQEPVGGSPFLVQIVEYSGFTSGVTLQATSSATASSGSTVAPGAVTATSPALVVTAANITDGDGHADDGFTGDPLWTTRLLTTQGQYAVNRDYSADRIVSAGTYNPTGSTVRTDCAWGVIAAVFRPSPVPGFWLDHDRDGFDTETGVTGAPLVRMLPQGSSGVSDEITSDVISIQIDRVADVSGGSPIGTMTVRTKNTSGKYNPDNTASSVYGKFNPGTPVWFGCNADGTLSGAGQAVYGRFGGYLRTVAPIASPGATDAPIAEWVFDDAMARYREAKCRVAFSTSRTVATYRTAILSAISETRTSLATESDTLAMSGSLGVRATTAPYTNYANTQTTDPLPSRPETDKRAHVSALAVLEDLNHAVGTRHFVAPADSKEDWYRYTTRNRQYKLGAAADASLTGSAGIADTSGYVLSVDGVVNAMSVEARPFRVNAQSTTVWEYPNLPFAIDQTAAKQIVADFPDTVFEAAITVTSTNSSVTATLVSTGEGATIVLTATTRDTVTALSVAGRQLIRLDPVLVEASDLSSQAIYGERQGPAVSSDLITSEGAAEGIANYHIWANANPRKTPSVTIYNRLSTLLPLDLFDVVTLTVSQLDVTARRFEIIGIHETWQRAASASMVLVAFTLDLRETPNQSALSVFTIGSSTLGGTDGLAP